MSDTTQSRSVVIQKNSTGPEVTDLQYILQARGFNPGATDGKFGSKTEDAVKRFQQSKNLKQDGVVGLQTWAAMDYVWADNQPGNFLREGDRGNAVLQLQEAMVSKGMNPGKPDSIFGSKTKAAIIEFQKNSGKRDTNVEGIVGPFTWGGIIGD